PAAAAGLGRLGHHGGMDVTHAAGDDEHHGHVHEHHGHGHEHDHHEKHEHEHHDHERPESWLARRRHAVRPHSHEAADKIDAAMEASGDGMRALWISLAVLAATAAIQAAVVALSGSVALLGDTLHNAADALTAVPLA